MRTLIEELASRISAHPTATEALNEWCSRRMEPRADGILAHVLVDEETDRASYGGPLAITKGESLRYRQVRLVWGETIVSEAENWYLPDRLPPAMRTRLLNGITPFGEVVRSLRPERMTVAVHSRDDLLHGGASLEQCMRRLAQVKISSPLETFVLHIRAVVTTVEHGDLAEVREHYRRELVG